METVFITAVLGKKVGDRQRMRDLFGTRGYPVELSREIQEFL